MYISVEMLGFIAFVIYCFFVGVLIGYILNEIVNC